MPRLAPYVTLGCGLLAVFATLALSTPAGTSEVVPSQATAPGKLPAPAEKEGATAADCVECHEVVESFAAGPHGRAMSRSSPEMLEGSCTACHGPGEQHIEDLLPESIVRDPPREACVACHPGANGRLWLAARGHRRHSVACLDCHASGHEGSWQATPLLSQEPFQLCGSCHQGEAATFHQPYAHREGSEPFGCTECHSAHGSERTGRLLAAGESGACLDCHTELAGPFVFPHPPRAVHGCADCHQPHGSTNPRLLNRRNVLNNCLECHTGVPAFHDLSQARFRNCVACHTAVHGSNRDSVLFDP